MIVMIALKYWMAGLGGWDRAVEESESRKLAEAFAEREGLRLVRFWRDDRAGGYFVEVQR